MEWMYWIAPVALAAAVFLMWRRGRGTGNAGGYFGGPSGQGVSDSATADLAQRSAAKLDAMTHQQVYALIAQGRSREAVEAYQNATGSTLFEATAAVTALARHPQVQNPEDAAAPGSPYPGNTGYPGNVGAPAAGPVGYNPDGFPTEQAQASGYSSQNDWTIPEEWTKEHGSAAGSGDSGADNSGLSNSEEWKSLGLSESYGADSHGAGSSGAGKPGEPGADGAKPEIEGWPQNPDWLDPQKDPKNK